MYLIFESSKENLEGFLSLRCTLMVLWENKLGSCADCRGRLTAACCVLLAKDENVIITTHGSKIQQRFMTHVVHGH